ncbi:MAG: hypothetical protein R3301_15650, partial [Saprospiraceae bacterium]|nr:hypothetical protein [Saprospiraceae bacterium]
GHTTLAPVQIVGATDVAGSARMVTDLLDGHGTEAQRAVVLTNAAMAIQCAAPDKDFTACYDLAQESLASGRAAANLRACIAFSQN